MSLSRLSRKAQKLIALLPRKKFRRGLRHGVAAAIEHERALSGLEINTVVDIGANIGQFSLLAWTLYPGARIYAFEPQSGPAAIFQKLFPTSAPITLYRTAIGTATGQIEMHVSRRHDSSSLLPISKTMTDMGADNDEIGTSFVSIASLASFLAPEEIVDPALLKIDVQGSELEVLKGSEPLLDRFRYICIELSFIELYTGQPLSHEVIRYLDGRGFQLISIHNLHNDAYGRSAQADFLFGRRALVNGRELQSDHDGHRASPKAVALAR